MAKKHKATEQMSFDEALEKLALTETYAKIVLARIGQIKPLQPGDTILEIGAAQGRFLIGCAKLGFKVVGIEPWEEAVSAATRLAEHEGVEILIHKGVAEHLPLPSDEFDVVVAASVIEHVLDVKGVFSEAYRVLKPGGVFWFETSSSVCPRQNEIQGFPFFGWYPDRLKHRIMEWAKTHRPHLVGHTKTPAINWFTPRKARRMLREAGFTKVYDRWDIRLPSEGGKNCPEGSRIRRIALRIIQLNAVTKFLADVLVPNCAYAAIK